MNGSLGRKDRGEERESGEDRKRRSGIRGERNELWFSFVSSSSFEDEGSRFGRRGKRMVQL